MKTKISQELFIKLKDGSTTLYLPASSSLRQAVVESIDKEEDASTSNDYLSYQLKDENRFSSQTNNFKSTRSPALFETEILDYIAQSEAEIRERIISQYANEIRILIQQDEFIDGEVSRSERYMQEGYEQGKLDFIADALMYVYSSNLGEAHMLEGILTMIASVPYEAISPKGQIMAMGLLANKTLSVRDKAIQCFERWNSKKGLAFLKNISCSPKWLQNYVDKVVMYIERDGTE